MYVVVLLNTMVILMQAAAVSLQDNTVSNHLAKAILTLQFPMAMLAVVRAMQLKTNTNPPLWL